MAMALPAMSAPKVSCTLAPSFSHSDTESTGATGVDELTYLKIMNLRLGLVMNFGMAT
jgi:hypothetical protein